MPLLRKGLFVFFALMVCSSLRTLAAVTYSPMESGSSLRFLGNAIVYKGDTIVLDETTIFLDGSLSDAVAASHPHVYNNFQKAAAHFVDGTTENHMRVLIAPYVYWADNPDSPEVKTGKDGREPFGMVINCHNLHLIGLTDKPQNVILASMRGQTQGAVGNFTMFLFIGDGLQVHNLTMGNYCNVDLYYPLKPELSRNRRSDAITQAHVAYCRGDRVVARNVRFISRLNMNPLNGAKRILFDHCHMECTDDALTGNGVFLGCTIHLYGQKPFYTTHRCGAVFLDCDFNVMGNNREMVFCKAPGVLSLIDCRYHTTDSTYVGWTNYPEPWMRCYQSRFTLNGKPYVVGGEMPENTVNIDGMALLSAFKQTEGCTKCTENVKSVYNVYNLLRGDDGWNPTNQPLCCSKDMPTALVCDKRRLELQTGGDSAIVTVKAMRHGGYPMSADTIFWRVDKGSEDMVGIEPLGGGRFLLVPTNNTDENAVFSVTFLTKENLQSAVAITVKPKKLVPPSMPKLSILKCNNDSLTLNWRLQRNNERDESQIVWYRAKDKHGKDAVPVSVSHQKPQYYYKLTAADNGYYIGASVSPKTHRTDLGEAVYISTSKAQRIETESISSVQTDFSDFPCQWQPEIIPGFWTVDGFKPQDTAEFPWIFSSDKNMWAYAKGFNGAVGWGLVQAQRGARLMYTPLDGTYGDMSLVLNVDPTKTAGQGFGSATGQYMDVCIKFDTRTLTGYALRIIRTTKHAKAVDFYLVEYKDGVTKPISKPISSGCYRTGCTIRLSAVDNRLTAQVETATPLPDSPLPTVVDLSADIAPNTFGGVAIQHTGSCGESTTMLHSLQVEY